MCIVFHEVLYVELFCPTLYASFLIQRPGFINPSPSVLEDQCSYWGLMSGVIKANEHVLGK